LLAQFARLEISLAELIRAFEGMLSVEFGPTERRLTSRFLCAEPGIRIEKELITNALEKRKKGGVAEGELFDWAAMLLLNDAYEWQGPDEEIAEVLNEHELAAHMPRTKCS